MDGNTRKAGAFPAQGKRAVAQLRQVFRIAIVFVNTRDTHIAHKAAIQYTLHSKPPDSTHEVVQSAPPFPHQPADENLNSRRGTKEAGQACVPRKKYELPRGAINLPRKKQGRASHSLSVGEPGAGFIFFKRNICLPPPPTQPQSAACTPPKA